MTTDELLQRWSDGTITADELRELTTKLAEPEDQSALLDDWLLESCLPERLPGATVAALPEALRAAPVIALAPQPSWLERLLAWFRPQEAEPLLALRWWSHASLAAAVVIGISMAVVLPRHERRDAEAETLAQIIFQRHFTNSSQP